MQSDLKVIYVISEAGKGQQYAKQAVQMLQLLLQKPLDDDEGNQNSFPNFIYSLLSYFIKVSITCRPVLFSKLCLTLIACMLSIRPI